MIESGRALSLDEAVVAFQELPSAFQLGSLHPHMVGIDALKNRALLPAYWEYREGGSRLLRFYHVTNHLDLGVKDIQSAYGYGGPFANCDAPEFVDAADRAFVTWAQRHGILAEFMRFHPLVPHERWYTGRVLPNRPTVCVNLGDDLFGQYLPRRRRNVRRFWQSGLHAEKVSADVMQATFPRIYASNMNTVGALDEYRFPDIYFNALLNFEQADAWLVLDNGEGIAGAIVLASPEARTVEYHLGASTADADQHQAMAGLLHTIALHYQASGYLRFYLGGGRSTAPDDSLLFFKKGFGPAELMFRTASVIYDTVRYQELARLLPERATSGRVLFYKG